MKIRLTIFIIISLLTQVNARDRDVDYLHRSQKILTDVIIHDIFSPPVASRIYVYSNISAFEVLASQQSELRSLYGQIKNFPAVVKPKEKINPALAAIVAFFNTAKKMIFSELRLRDSLLVLMREFESMKIPRKEFNASVQFGKLVSGLVLSWAGKDMYKETRSMRRYSLKKGEGNWIPTAPGYMAAIEPHWARIRTIALDSAYQFKPPPPHDFSKADTSKFYKEAFEVYKTGKELSHEDSAIASFWDCNPFFINTQGHLNFASKKISPGGHWISITGVACKKINANIYKSSAAYTYTSIALFDGFISCWAEKYTSHVIRPETYINAYINEAWRPLLQTPPFPEYTSGHSVISTAAAEVLTHYLGDDFSFDDDTEIEFGLPVRSFTSFRHASNEAAISRLYGGIHYRAAIANGQVQGRWVGEWVIKQIKLTQ